MTIPNDLVLSRVHPAADIFPAMNDADYAALKADIKVNGLHEPLWIYDGMLLDGRNRLRACQELGIEPDTRDYTGDNPVGFVVSLNVHRRHLDTSQRAMIAAKIAKLPRGANQHAQICASSQNEAANLLNVSRRSVQSARQVLDSGTPELVKAVERGNKSISAALRDSKPAKPAKSKVTIPPQAEAPDLADELAEARKAIIDLSDEIDSMALSAMPESELMAKVKKLEAELRVTRQQRDAYMKECGELKRQNAFLQRQIKNLAA